MEKQLIFHILEIEETKDETLLKEEKDALYTALKSFYDAEVERQEKLKDKYPNSKVIFIVYAFCFIKWVS